LAGPAGVPESTPARAAPTAGAPRPDSTPAGRGRRRITEI